MSDPESIQADIERSRAELAATVDELTDRLGERKAQAQSVAVKAGAAVGAVLLAYVAWRVVRRVRS